MSERIWVLGAPDPEMAAIEALLRECGETVTYALDGRGERVRPDNAYQAVCPDAIQGGCGEALDAVYRVECAWDPSYESLACVVSTIDHHRPGDPGYGRPPSEFLAASSLGQVIAELARLGRLPPEQIVGGRLAWSRGPSLNGPGMYGPPAGVIRHMHRDDVGQIGACQSGWHVLEPDPAGVRAVAIPDDLVLTAAADHCLGAAYAGECPGVDPEELLRWRAEGRARFQGRRTDEVLEDLERARAALLEAPVIDLTPDSPEPLHGPDTPFVPRKSLVRDLREAYTVSTVLVAPFATGATVDANGVGDSTAIVFGPRDEGAWDEGGHHTFVRRGVPELPDAASREGVAYLAYVDHDGSGRPCRPKVVLGGRTTPEMVRAFVDHWAPAQGLVDAYGDPERGFAGAYLQGDEACY